MHELSYMGPRAFNHSQSNDAEAEYDRLRDLARQEASKRGDCFQRSQEAYTSGDGAAAKQLSEQGKAHGRKMEEYNRQASEFIFRENNASGRVDDDEIDLHGQFVEEAEDILEERIKYARSHGQNHLHVIVGKGNHSANHVQKIKPRVERVCRELGLQYRTEENEGRIYVNLTGGSADDVPSKPSGGYGHGHGQQHHGQQHHAQPHHQQQHHQQQQQQHGENQDQVEQVVHALLPRVIRKLEKACCIVM
ncbi:Smr domain-containing protein [Aspergillus stella-maris]|uniref:Smr domain-containing protein n=1 Tax=Aspergillus stella-maris TaxID=1810926 RepID=UPI003CCDE3EF